MDDRRAPCKALVLAGGGARGSYQVGVWRALMELDWHPQIITGTSVGSLNGAMFVLDQYETGPRYVAGHPQQGCDGAAGGGCPTFRPLHQFLRSVVESRRHGCDPAGRDRGAGAGRGCPARGSHPLRPLSRWSSGA